MERALDAMASFTARTADAEPTDPPSAAASGAPPSEAAAAVAGYVFPARVSQAVVTAARLVEQVFVFAFALFFRYSTRAVGDGQEGAAGPRKSVEAVGRCAATKLGRRIGITRLADRSLHFRRRDLCLALFRQVMFAYFFR